MKVLLASLNSKYVHSNLAIRYIKNYSKSYNIDLFEATINENPMDIAFKIYNENPEVIGFSCYIWNIENTLKLCSTLKKLNKNIKIILGGPEVTYNPSDYLEKYDFIDYIIAGEGEIAFNLLIKYFYGEESLDNIIGVYYKENNSIKGEQNQVIENLDVINFPYKDKNDLPNKIVYYEASRGCPFSCKYCLSSVIRGTRFFPIDRVKKELLFFIENGTSLVKFVDRTFNANKKFSMEIWDFLIKNKGNTVFHFEIAADILDDEIIEFLKTAPKGLFQFEIGVQSTNDKILKNINRPMNFKKVKDNVGRIIDGDNIQCHLDLIAGLPGEDIESFKKSFNDCMEINPHVLQLGFLKILKGSPMESESQSYGMKWCDYPPYQILSTNTMSSSDIIGLIEIEKVFEDFYNSHIFRKTMQYILENVEDKYKFFFNFKEDIKKEEYFIRSFNLKDKFKFLYNYLKEQYCAETLKDILLLDFLVNTKKSNLPDFLIVENEKGLRDVLHDNKESLENAFINFEFKRLFSCKVNTKIYKKDGVYIYEKGKYILVVNLEQGNYTYI